MFEKQVIEHKMCVLIFSTFVCNICQPKKHRERYDKKCILVFMYNTRYSCRIVMKLGFSRQILENTHTKFHENPFSGSRVVPCGQKWRS